MPAKDKLRAVRQWKRDGTTHRMSLGNAAHVVRGNPMPSQAYALTTEQATTRLLAGERVETPLSFIYLE
jgi:hypothetical protein